jgi:hypothetical protein
MGYQNHTHKVFIRHKGRCFYCNRKVFCPKFAKHKNVELIKLHDLYILCKINQQYRVFAVGTLDHLIRQKDYGEDTPNNLVLACATCNKRREPNHRRCPTLEEILLMNQQGKLCDCGNFTKKNGRKCSTCAKLSRTNKCILCGNTAKHGHEHRRPCLKKIPINMYYI